MIGLTDKKEALEIIHSLADTYPHAKCELEYGDVFQLLVAVILSAQCTDKRVNQITKGLFKKLPDVYAFDKIPLAELEKDIYSCGFYHNKAKNIKNTSRDIIERFNGNVPSSFEQLLTLAGVGRKTASVVYSVGFGGNAIAVDTHVFRTSNRIGFVNAKNPLETEKGLRALFPEKMYAQIHHLLIFHGRYCCHSQSPDCMHCPIKNHCRYIIKKI